MAENPISSLLETLKNALPISELRDYQEALASAAAYENDFGQGLTDLDDRIRTLSSSLLTLSRTGIAQLTASLKENTNYIRFTNNELLKFIESVEKKFPGGSAKAISSLESFMQKHKAMRDDLVKGNKQMQDAAYALAIVEGNGQAAAILNQMRNSVSRKGAASAQSSAGAAMDNAQLGIAESTSGKGFEAVLGTGGELATWLSYTKPLMEIMAVGITALAAAKGIQTVGNLAKGAAALFGLGGAAAAAGGATAVAGGAAAAGGTALTGAALAAAAAPELMLATGVGGFMTGRAISGGMGWDPTANMNRQSALDSEGLDFEEAKMKRRRAAKEKGANGKAGNPGDAAAINYAKYQQSPEYGLDDLKLQVYAKQQAILEKMYAPSQARLAIVKEEYAIENDRYIQLKKLYDLSVAAHDPEAKQLELKDKMLEQQGKALDKVNFVRRSMLEGLTASAMGISSGSSSTMPRNLARAQLERSGTTQGQLQTTEGFVDPTNGQQVGANTQTYSQQMSMFGLGKSQGREPAQEAVELLKEIAEKLDKQIEATKEAGDKPLTLQPG